jgi:hypothetical protein
MDYALIAIALVWFGFELYWLSGLSGDDRTVLKMALGPFGLLVPKPKISVEYYISPELYEQLKDDTQREISRRIKESIHGWDESWP